MWDETSFPHALIVYGTWYALCAIHPFSSGSTGENGQVPGEGKVQHLRPVSSQNAGLPGLLFLYQKWVD